MFMLIIQSLLLIALAYLIGCLLGCLAKKLFAVPDEPRYVTALPEPVKAQPVKAEPVKPEMAMPAPAAPLAASPSAHAPETRAEDIYAANAVDMVIPAGKDEEAARADAVGSRPKVLAAPLASGKDNLKRIRGIGPKNESALNDLGIFHFAQIAALNAREVLWVGSFLAFPGRIEREKWLDQAKLLAAGTETDFSKRVDKGEVETSKPKK